MRLIKLSKWHPVISLALIFSKLQDHQIPDLWLCDHPFTFREFFIDGVEEGLHQKGRTLVLLKSLSFPSNKFPFSCLTARLALFFSALTLQFLLVS